MCETSRVAGGPPGMDSAPERILIDAAAAQGGGGFTYLVNVLPLLAALAPNTRFRVLVRGSGLASSLPEIENLEIYELPSIGLLGRFRFLFLVAPRLAREWGADIYFAVGEYCPLGLSCPSVISFRNWNIFTDLEQGWPLSQRLRLVTLKRLALISARNASRVLFVSEDSAQRIGDSTGLPAEKRAVVHHGIDLDRWRATAVKQAKPAGSVKKDDVGILSVSSIYRYKNFVRLIEAYHLLHESGVPLPVLTIVGGDQDPDYSARMREAPGCLWRNRREYSPGRKRPLPRGGRLPTALRSSCFPRTWRRSDIRFSKRWQRSCPSSSPTSRSFARLRAPPPATSTPMIPMQWP